MGLLLQSERPARNRKPPSFETSERPGSFLRPLQQTSTQTRTFPTRVRCSRLDCLPLLQHAALRHPVGAKSVSFPRTAPSLQNRNCKALAPAIAF